MKGTSNEDRPGKTRTLAKAWSDWDGFAKALGDWQAAVDALQSKAGAGQGELAAAVGELGKSCGGCHKPYRRTNSSLTTCVRACLPKVDTGFG